MVLQGFNITAVRTALDIDAALYAIVIIRYTDYNADIARGRHIEEIPCRRVIRADRVDAGLLHQIQRTGKLLVGVKGKVDPVLAGRHIGERYAADHIRSGIAGCDIHDGDLVIDDFNRLRERRISGHAGEILRRDIRLGAYMMICRIHEIDL